MGIIFRILEAIILVGIVVVIAGYIGHWYAESNDCVSCKIGVGGECGVIGSFEGDCDMKNVTLCWVPVCEEKPVEGNLK